MKRLFGSALIVMGLTVMSASAAEKKSPMDTNDDGKVSKQEFCDARSKAMEKAGKKFNEAATEKQFSARDANKDGFLTGDELVAKPQAPKKAAESTE